MNLKKSKSHATSASSHSAAAQPGAQGDAGLRFGLFSPSSVRPHPLARALGSLKKEHESFGSRVRGNIGLWLCRIVKASVSRQFAGKTLAVAVLEGKASVCTT